MRATVVPPFEVDQELIEEIAHLADDAETVCRGIRSLGRGVWRAMRVVDAAIDAHPLASQVDDVLSVTGHVPRLNELLERIEEAKELLEAVSDLESGAELYGVADRSS